MPTSLLDLMGYMQGQADTGTALRKQGQLAQLASQAYAAPRDQRGPLVQQAIATDPQSGFALDKSLQGGDDERMQRVGQMAGMLVSLPPQARAQAYPGIVQQLHSIGLGQGLPDQWSEDLLPYAQQLAGISGGGTGVQSTYIDAQGNRVAIMRDGSTQILGQNAPQNQIIDTGNGFFGVNKGNLQAQPVMVGGQQPYRIDPSLPPEVQASIRADESAYAAMPDGASVDIGQQLRSAPKPQTPREPSDIERRLALAQQMGATPEELKSLVVGSSGPKPMSDYQRAQMQQKLVKAKTSIRGTVSDLDRMAEMARQVMQAPGLERTTGIMGALPNIPGSAAADAEAKLNSLKSQIAFAVLAKMRAMSPTGGALGSVSDAEGKRLEANLASLDKAQSYEQLRQNLQQIIDYTNTSKQNIHGAFQEDFGEFQQGQAPARSAPAGGGWKIEVVK